jgi:predicted Zn-dependent protease
MDYSNPDIPEGINYSKTHPLKEFVLLTTGVFGVLFVAVLVLGFFADHFAQHIPFAVEKKFHIMVPDHDDGTKPLQDYLYALTQRVAAAEDLPPGMDITVHYVDSDTINAYATLGGHIILYRGLLEKLQHENALAMVIAHEISHVKYRHVIRSMGSGLVVGIALSMVSASLGNTVINGAMNETSQVGMLKFSRLHEQEADDAGLDALQKMYGHLGGAEELFTAIKTEEIAGFVPQFLRTHPDTSGRINHIRQLRQQRGQHEPTLTPLPVEFTDWLHTEPVEEEDEH